MPECLPSGSAATPGEFHPCATRTASLGRSRATGVPLMPGKPSDPDTTMAFLLAWPGCDCPLVVDPQTRRSMSSDASPVASPDDPLGSRNRWPGVCWLIPGLVVIATGLLGWSLWRQLRPLDATLDFAGIRVVFIAGDQQHPFGQLLAQGARQAERDLGCRVTVVDSSWQRPRMVEAVRAAIVERPDALCLLGHPGDQELTPLVDEAVAAGIVVTCQNVDLPALRATHAGRGFGYVGNQQRMAGQLMADGCLRRFPPRSGDQAVVMTVSTAQQGPRAIRSETVRERLAQGGYATTLRIWDVAADTGSTNGGAEGTRIADALRQDPALRLVVCDDPRIALALMDHLAGSGLQLACFDLTPAVAAAVDAGRIHLVGDQQPLLQGYLPVVQACLSVRGRFTGVLMDTGLRLVDQARLRHQPGLAGLRESGP